MSDIQRSRYLCTGPGGRRCACCFPAPGSKDRRAQWRSAKRKADREAMRQIENDIADQEAMYHEDLVAELEQDQYFYDEYDYYDYYLRMEERRWEEEEAEREYYRRQENAYEEPFYYDDDY